MQKLAERGVHTAGLALDPRGLPGLASSAAAAFRAEPRGLPVSEILVYLVATAVALAVGLAALKGMGFIAWSWAWALAPLTAAFSGVLCASALFAAAAFRQIARRRARARR